MSDPLVVTADDLATFLNEDVDEDRANLMLDLAQTACVSIVDPLIAATKGTVLAIAARAYTNPVQFTTQSAGPFSQGATVGGLTLTRAEERQLRRIAGGGGAFTINPLPADAGQCLPWWDGFGSST